MNLDREDSFAIILIGLLSLMFGLYGCYNWYLYDTREDRKSLDKLQYLLYSKKKELKDLEVLEKTKKLELEKTVYKKRIDEIISKYGEPSKIYHYINSPDFYFNIEKDLVVFDATQHVLLNGRDLNFSDIIGVCLSDEKAIVKGETIVKTRKSGGLVAAAALELLVGKPEYSIADSNLAEEHTVIEKGVDFEVHNYTLNVNIKDFVTPVLFVEIGQNTQTANEILGLFNLIIENTKTTNNL